MRDFDMEPEMALNPEKTTAVLIICSFFGGAIRNVDHLRCFGGAIWFGVV